MSKGLKQALLASFVAGVVAVGAQPAKAMAILDDWSLNLSVVNGEGTFTGLSDATGIDHINVVGYATVNQTVVGGSALGQPFNETGTMQFSTYSPEGGVGVSFFDLGDAQTMYIDFVGLTGVLNADETITFDSQVGTVRLLLDSDDVGTGSGTLLELAEFEIIAPSGGSDLNFYGGAGANATIDVTLNVISVIDPSLFQDMDGNDLDELSLTFHLVNTDSLLDPNFDPNPDNSAVVDGNGTSVIRVQNNGQYNIAQTQIPEPGSLALLGTGLVAFGWLGRRYRKS